MARLDGRKRASVVVMLCIATALAAPAQTFTTLVSFDFANGADPTGRLAQGRDGKLYGTTENGGYLACNDANGCGTVFKITRGGALTELYAFCAQDGCTDGSFPVAGLTLAMDGNFYGTTILGGKGNCIDGCGTVFGVSSVGKLTTVYSFCLQNTCPPGGDNPYGALSQASDGNFYGTTAAGGISDADCSEFGGCGTVFRITPAGRLTTLYNFDFSDGAVPNQMLVQGVDGNLYGTTSLGGDPTCDAPFGCGTAFKLTPQGRLTTLHRFDLADGIYPSELVQAPDGTFYGVTFLGGDPTCDTPFGCGTVFKITPRGTLTTLHSFGGTDGARPSGGLIQATDGNFYGTTSLGGDLTCNDADGCGTVFQITPDGSLSTLHVFEASDGLDPFGGLLQATNGIIYGTTAYGGNFDCSLTNGCGTIFSLDMGLGPFVRQVRDSGKVGVPEGLLGQGLTGTTSVSFNGTPAQFKVVSDTFLKATVPNGATTGYVSLTTPSGRLTSNKPFRVTPQLLSFDPPGGPVGTQVTITGVSLTQTKGVDFGNRIPARFTVNSDTQVAATVPQGAKTGKIGIETKGGIAISSGTFTVTP